MRVFPARYPVSTAAMMLHIMRSTNQVYLITILLYNHAQRIALGNPATARSIGVTGRRCFGKGRVGLVVATLRFAVRVSYGMVY